jgi:hypothetical protein
MDKDPKYFSLIKLLVKIFLNYNPDESKITTMNDFIIPIIDKVLENNTQILTYQVFVY